MRPKPAQRRPAGERQPRARRPGRVRRIAAVVALAGLACCARALIPGGAAAATPAPGATPGHPAAAVTTAARQPSAPGGLCSVPGIGDIGSLVNLCTLGSSGLIGDLNNVCQPSLPNPDPANSGLNTMISPPSSGRQPATLYGSYGVAGQSWNATNLQCSDMTSLIGNDVANLVFSVAKAIDRVTITIYQAAAGNGILSWLTSVVNKLISSLGKAIYFPYLAPVVIIGTMWLAWQGLIRRRATRTIEGTIWMVVACAAAIWLIGRPADFTGMGTGVSNGMTQALNTAFAKLPAPSQSGCLPVTSKDPQVQQASFGTGTSSTVVAENANNLWTVLVCKPWLAGEFGTTAYSAPGSTPTAVNTYGRQLLWAQAIATNEKPTSSLIQAKQSTYAGIAASIQQNDPSIYPLFQGKDWTSRLQIGFAALFAAAIAGVLVLLISVTLILLKLGFLLLLVTGPFFLLVGTHPGFGRVIAVRWFEMLVGVLLKQAAVALVLSVLLYCYSLIMDTSDSVLPWALKIVMIALVTIAVYIYRKPFQHLFSAVGYGMIGSTATAETQVERVRPSVRENALARAAGALPGLATFREIRLARRSLGAIATAATGMAAVTGTSAAGGKGSDGDNGRVASDGTGSAAEAGAEGSRAGGRTGVAVRAREEVSTGNGQARSAPPLNLPSRNGGARAARSGAAGSAAASPPTSGSAPPRPARSSSASPGSAPSRSPQPGSVPPAAARPGWPLRPGPSPRQMQTPPARQQVRQPTAPPVRRPPAPPVRGQDAGGPGDAAAPPRPEGTFWPRPRRRK